MATQLRVRKFDPSTIKNHRIILVVGKRGSGKSVLLEDLLYNLRDRFDYCMAMCPTLESANMLRSCMPDCCVYNRFSQAKLDLFVQTAREVTTKKKERSFLLVLDDVFYDKSVCRSQAMRYLFLNGRHAHCHVICLVQYMIDLPPDLRSNVDYVFSMRESVLANRIKLYKMFFGVFGSFEDFAAVFERCTQNYECIALDNTLPSSTAAECIFWYKAQLGLPDFRLARPVYYDLTARYKRAEGSQGPSAEEQDAASKRPKVMVHKEGQDDPDSEER